MPRFYTVPFENVAISVTQDLFELTPADDKPIAVYGLTLDNVSGVADAGDAQEEFLRLKISRGNTASGSGGSAPTPAPIGKAAAAGFTAEVNNTTPATTGTEVMLWPLGWNVRVPLREFLPEEAWCHASQLDTLLLVRLMTAPADSIAVSGCLWVAEFG